MDKTLAGVLGAAGVLALAHPGNAAPVLHAASYAELLQPIPNAAATLHAMDSANDAPAGIELVQLPPVIRELVRPGHHHHHHHRYYRRRHHHHHHHHDERYR